MSPGVSLVCVMFFVTVLLVEGLSHKNLNTSNWFNIAFLIIHKSPRKRLKPTRPSPSCGWGLGTRLGRPGLHVRADSGDSGTYARYLSLALASAC